MLRPSALCLLLCAFAVAAPAAPVLSHNEMVCQSCNLTDTPSSRSHHQTKLHLDQTAIKSSIDQHVAQCANDLVHSLTHIFTATIGNQPVAMCVPQKNGNRFWSSFLYRTQITDKQFLSFPLLGGKEAAVREPPFSDLGKKLEIYYKSSAARRLYLTDDSALRIMIVRNPYTRLLSGYLDKVAKDHIKFFFTFWETPPKTFADFVIWLANYKRTRKSSISQSFIHEYYARHIFLPQSDHCLLPCGTKYKYLKLEDAYSWYPCLVDRLNVSDIMSRDWGNPPCFFSNEGNCNTSEWKRTPCHHGGMHHTQQKFSSGRYHPTGDHTINLLMQHYTPAAAALVSELFADDFEWFGYPHWNGSLPVILN